MTPPTGTRAAKRGKAKTSRSRPAKGGAKPVEKGKPGPGRGKRPVKAVKDGRRPSGTKPPKEVSAKLVEIGGAIRAERLRQNMSAETIARLLGVRRQVIGRVERGDSTVGVGSWLGTLRVLGLLDGIEVKAADAGARRRARGAPFVPF